MSAVERLRLSAARKLFVDDGLAVSLAAFLSVGGLALANGGYFPVSWGWSALGLLALAFVALAFGVGTRPGVLSIVLLVFLAGLTIWTVVSAVWTLDETKTINELERGLVYLAAAGTVLVLVRRSGAKGLVVGVWTAISIVSVYGLAIWLFPQYLGYEDPAFRDRLSAPVGYWNAFGVLAAIGALLALGLAARAKVVLRCSAAASTVPILITLYFTFSRGGWISFAAGLVAMIALDRRRLQLLTTAFVLAPWPILGIWLASLSEALTHSNSSLTAVARDGHGLAVVVIFLAAAAGVAILLLDAAESRLRVPRGVALTYGALMALVVLLGASTVFAKYGSPATLASRAYHSFNAAAPGTNGALNKRLFSLSGNGRTPQFHTAWQEVKAYPWLGSGAGTYDIYWFQHRQVRSTVHDVHNLYLETLAELGPVGLLLLLGVLVVPVLAAVRARGHPLAAAAFGAYVAFLLHAAVDWDWEMPTVTLAGLFCGLALLVCLKGDGRERSLPRIARAGGLALILGVSGFVALTLLGNSALSASSDATTAGSYKQAESEARRAMDFLPWSVEPLRRLGEAEAGANHFAAARVSFRKAIAKEPNDWTLWFDLAQVSTGRTQKVALAQALRLNPLSPEIAAWEADHRSAAP